MIWIFSRIWKSLFISYDIFNYIQL
jgi:hypothetical protein